MSNEVIVDSPSRIGNWYIEPFSDMSAAFFFSSDPFRVCVLDRLSWWIYELADCRSEVEIAAHVANVSSGRIGEGEEAQSFVRDRLDSLRLRGLVA